MSQPSLTETVNGHTSLAVQVDNGVLRVTSDPGFTSDNGDGCPYRAVVLEGPIMYGTNPPKRTAADFRWDGFFETRADLAAWRKPVTPGPYRFRVYAGTLFKGWGDNPGDFIEWGADDLGQNPSGVPVVNELTFTVPVTIPPAPPEWTYEELIQLARTYAKAAMGKTLSPRKSAPVAFFMDKVGNLRGADQATRQRVFAALDKVPW